MSRLFQLTVPGYIRGLEQLSHGLSVGEKWADEHQLPHGKLLEARLAPDMQVSSFAASKEKN